MPDIDANSEQPKPHLRGDQITFKLWLIGTVTKVWRNHYNVLARSNEAPATIKKVLRRAWIIVTLPADTQPANVAKTLDDARELVKKTDELDEAVKIGGRN
jgi:hypothetical protein